VILAGAAAVLALAVACTPTTEVTVVPGETGSTMRGVTVSGEGTVSVRPDIAIVNLAVEVTEPTVADARSGAAEAMQSVRDALAARGVAEADIQTQYFNIYPQYSYAEREAPQIVAFTVYNAVTVKVRDLDNASDVLDSAIDAGGDAVRVHGISFTVEDPESHLSDARREAVENARARAEVLAAAAGVSLGEAVSISESMSYPGEFFPGRAMDGMGGMASPVAPGEQTLRVNVSVVFSIAE
jgi:uncharacterized protein